MLSHILIYLPPLKFLVSDGNYSYIIAYFGKAAAVHSKVVAINALKPG
jgi:hypothetical protein